MIPAAARRLAGLVAAARAVFDAVAAASSVGLGKGPRGGGRNPDQIIGHVISADAAYARKLGVQRKQPAADGITATAQLRQTSAAVLAAPSVGSPLVPGGWTTCYAARRIAWHVLEHAWEIQTGDSQVTLPRRANPASYAATTSRARPPRRA